jgi:hypothetical protein
MANQVIYITEEEDDALIILDKQDGTIITSFPVIRQPRIVRIRDEEN